MSVALQATLLGYTRALSLTVPAEAARWGDCCGAVQTPATWDTDIQRVGTLMQGAGTRLAQQAQSTFVD